jgi:hypothetical protein
VDLDRRSEACDESANVQFSDPIRERSSNEYNNVIVQPQTLIGLAALWPLNQGIHFGSLTLGMGINRNSVTDQKCISSSSRAENQDI